MVYPRKTERLRIIVGGYIVRGPLGGYAWYHLQYVLGLAGLGHDVYFVEDSDDYPSCYDPVRDVMDTDPSYGLAFVDRLFSRADLGARWAYYDAHASRWLGPCSQQIVSLCETADLYINVAGVNPLRPWLRRIPGRALIDQDPVFTQIRHLTDPAAREQAAAHTAFFTFGENLCAGRAAVPHDGFPWQPTRQPVVLRAEAVTPGPAGGKFTTVMQWHSYPAREYGGVRYGMKSDSFDPYLDLPARVGRVLELAVGSPKAPRAMLRRNGWTIRDPRGPTHDLGAYRRYIRRSKAEFSVAKHGYVVSRSGWFSERSLAYLAAGRPVLVQDTGFTEWLHAGAGVIAFTAPDEAVAGVEEINRRYEFHCRAAREVAEAYFDARRVLPDLLERSTRAPAAASDLV
jgi:hypothetical protein